MAKEVFEAMTATGKGAQEIVSERGLGQISDEGALEALVIQLVQDNPKVVEEYRGGNQRVLGFFVGQVMKQTKGQANPQLVNELLRRHLEVEAS
jgi:aspartyl-tRNA(Asn)/glutamyl-tRNA(Gln) amidotransferase subunit B